MILFKGRHLLVLRESRVIFGSKIIVWHWGCLIARVFGESKVIRLLSIIHNGIILDLVCGLGGSVGEDVRANFPPSRREISFLLLASKLVRSGNFNLDSSKVTSYLSENVARFIGPGWGVDKGEGFFV